MKYQGLCFRCEYRALFLEKKRQPRYECSMVENCVVSCYMFKPAKPVITVPSDYSDPRPRFGPAMISSREQGYDVAENIELSSEINGDKIFLYWTPKKEERKCGEQKMNYLQKIKQYFLKQKERGLPLE